MYWCTECFLIIYSYFVLFLILLLAIKADRLMKLNLPSSTIKNKKNNQVLEYCFQ